MIWLSMSATTTTATITATSTAMETKMSWFSMSAKNELNEHRGPSSSSEWQRQLNARRSPQIGGLHGINSKAAKLVYFVLYSVCRPI